MPSQKVEPQGENFASCFKGVDLRLEEVSLKEKKRSQEINKQWKNLFNLIWFFSRQIDVQSKQSSLFVLVQQKHELRVCLLELMPGTNLELKRLTSEAKQEFWPPTRKKTNDRFQLKKNLSCSKSIYFKKKNENNLKLAYFHPFCVMYDLNLFSTIAN